MLRPFSFAFVVLLVFLSHRATAQVVQLPTFDMFGIGTTVSVPTGGSTVLGGIGRSGASRAGGGVPGLGRFPGIGRPFGNRGTASSVSGGSARVTATIHDFQGMDRMLLSQAAARRGSRVASQIAAPGLRIAQWQLDSLVRGPAPATSSAQRPALGLAEIRRQRSIDARAKESEVERLISQATAAQSQGKHALAKMVYRMAAKKTDDDLLRQRIFDLMSAANKGREEISVSGRR